VFVSKDLVFVELHKTAGTHIAKWLSKLIPGEQIGKHNRVPRSLWDRFILGSIRNPWDWYVSLWAYGCSARGGIFLRTTGRTPLSYGARHLPSEMGALRYPIGPAVRQMLADFRLPKTEWQDVYRDSSDADQFRRWLRLMFDEERRFDLGEGYGFCNVSSSSGLLTYRYLKLFTRLGYSLYDSDLPSSPESLRELWQKNRLTRFEIRSEELESDLLSALKMAEIEVPKSAELALLAARSAKTNTSTRLSTEHYYDDATSDLVSFRERLIIDQYGYESPLSDGTRPSQVTTG